MTALGWGDTWGSAWRPPVLKLKNHDFVAEDSNNPFPADQQRGEHKIPILYWVFYNSEVFSVKFLEDAFC